MKIRIPIVSILAGLLMGACGSPGDKVLFQDIFDSESLGELRQNIIQLPPPEGLGYKWKVLESGHDPAHWIMVDEKGPEDPKKGFWVIPPDSSFLQQGGRSHNSVLYCLIPVPPGTNSYDIFFRQYRADNDYIGYIVGAEEMALHAGTEFGYQTQVPGTDSTTSDAHIKGDLGVKTVADMALMHQWADHRIEVRDGHILWYLNNHLLLSGSKEEQDLHGYFGIRHRYERNTRYDDFRIRIY